jgi:hypothetical protein
LLENCKFFVYTYDILLNFTFSLFRSSAKELSRKGPDTADIEVASEFLIRLGAGLGFREAYYAMILDNLVFWMEVKSCIPFKRI